MHVKLLQITFKLYEQVCVESSVSYMYTAALLSSINQWLFLLTNSIKQMCANQMYSRLLRFS